MYPDDFDVENDNCHPSHFFCSLFWEDPDISELYLRRQFRHLVLVTSTGKQNIAALNTINTFTFAILRNWYFWPLVLADVLCSSQLKTQCSEHQNQIKVQESWFHPI